MVQLTIIALGTLKEKYLSDAVEEYKKRLGAFAKVDCIEIKEERITDEDDATKTAAALLREGEKILQKLPKDSFKIALCVEGRTMDSTALAARIGAAADQCGKIALVIGSSHGLSSSVKQACDLSLSISPLTFPHQLMRVILLEVLYRSFCIISGKKYHK